ncbi:MULTISPECIES: type II toxin-antitoxin system RelE/ParE family toxin [unclassified Microcoleus]|uniref:type II toxin-antitoxin system RelE/ParE family toxin n=1 Tax=unclassified Microcoleus TaxID=2642155 RepID=UPI002FD3A643
MNRYRLSQQAEKDLEDIWIYLGDQDEIAADRFPGATARSLSHACPISEYGATAK